jgi:predicted acylesterase/phospholipase RssA
MPPVSPSPRRLPPPEHRTHDCYQDTVMTERRRVTSLRAGSMTTQTWRHRAGEQGPAFLSVAYGGGGPFAIAYGLGVVDALRAAGVPIERAEAIGTSAGSWVAACTAVNLSFDELCQFPQVSVPDLRVGRLLRAARDAFAESREHRVTTTATTLLSGRRVLLRGANHHLAEMVAASSAVPLLFAPVRVEGRFLVDGGVRSLVHADQAAPARHLLVIAPLAGPVCGPAGRAVEAITSREMRQWQASDPSQRHLVETHLVRPNRAIANMARSPWALFDYAIARQVYPMAYQQASALLEEREDLRSLVFAPVRRAA